MLNITIFLMTLGFTRLVTGGSLIKSDWILPKNGPNGWLWVKMGLWHRTTLQARQVTFHEKN
jgi:hypothetical protein